MLKAFLFQATSYDRWWSADVETVSSSSKAQHHVSAGVITPNDWTYTALQTLVKHGAITDTHGFVFDGNTSYTKDELMPLIDEVVTKRGANER